MNLLNSFIIFGIIVLLANGDKPSIPSNFYGSHEVFSGFLSNFDDVVNAFTLRDDHVSISGSIEEVESKLANITAKGTFCQLFSEKPMTLNNL